MQWLDSCWLSATPYLDLVEASRVNPCSYERICDFAEDDRRSRFSATISASVCAAVLTRRDFSE